MNKEHIPSDYIKSGIIIREWKNRFLCEDEVDSRIEVCYVPSLYHSDKLINLANKEELLIPNISKKAKTSYALLSVPYKRSYIVLNSSMANRAVKNSLRKRLFSYLGKRMCD